MKEYWHFIRIICPREIRYIFIDFFGNVGTLLRDTLYIPRDRRDYDVTLWLADRLRSPRMGKTRNENGIITSGFWIKVVRWLTVILIDGGNSQLHANYRARTILYCILDLDIHVRRASLISRSDDNAVSLSLPRKAKIKESESM